MWPLYIYSPFQVAQTGKMFLIGPAYLPNYSITNSFLKISRHCNPSHRHLNPCDLCWDWNFLTYRNWKLHGPVRGASTKYQFQIPVCHHEFLGEFQSLWKDRIRLFQIDSLFLVPGLIGFWAIDKKKKHEILLIPNLGKAIFLGSFNFFLFCDMIILVSGY